jgi:hypothetical protein
MYDKEPKNKQGMPHGLWECYYTDGVSNEPILWYSGWYIDNVDLGYWIEEETIQIYYAR